MKKIYVIMATVAIMAAGCAKDETPETGLSTNHDELVSCTIGVSINNTDDPSARASFENAADGKSAKVRWKADDQLAIWRADATAGVFVFTLESGSEGSSSGAFTGNISGTDNVYAVHPYNATLHGVEGSVMNTGLNAIPLVSLTSQTMAADGWAHLDDYCSMVCQLGGYQRPATDDIYFKMDHVTSIMDLPISIDRAGGYAEPVKILSVEVTAPGLYSQADIDFTKATGGARLSPRAGSTTAIKASWAEDEEPILTVAEDKATARFALFPFWLHGHELTIKVNTDKGEVVTSRPFDRALEAGKRYHHSELVLDMATVSNISKWDGNIPAADADYAFSGGTGYPANPWLISSAADLAQLAANVNANLQNGYADRVLKLTTDIDLGGSFNTTTKTATNAWPMMGTTGNMYFRGHLDGDGHTIKNMVVSSSAAEAGFIARAVGGIVTNLTFDEGCYVYATPSANGFYVGGIVGNSTESRYASDRSETRVMSDCEFKGTVHVAATTTGTARDQNVGGIIGRIQGPMYIVDACKNSGNVILELVSSTGNVDLHAGGIVGVGGVATATTASWSGYLINCVNTGSVTFKTSSTTSSTVTVGVGGMAGRSYGFKFINCLNTGTLSVMDENSAVNNPNTAGILGRGQAMTTESNIKTEIVNCLSTGEIQLLLGGSVSTSDRLCGIASVADTGLGIMNDSYFYNRLSTMKTHRTAGHFTKVNSMYVTELQMQGESMAGTLSGGASYSSVLNALNQGVAVYNDTSPEVEARQWAQGYICPVIK